MLSPSQKQALEVVVVNDGLHLHAVVLVQQPSRLGTGLKRQVRENERLDLGNHGKLRCVDVQRVKRGTEAKVVDYSTRTWRRGRMTTYEVLVLPAPSSNQSPRTCTGCVTRTRSPASLVR